MKQKKSFSKIDYYWMFIDQFKDQMTIVLIFNLIIFFVANHFGYFADEVFLLSNFRDFFKFLTEQFSLHDFFEVLAYTYLTALVIHFGTYKQNKNWMFHTNAVLLIIVSSYFWSIPRLDNIILHVENLHLYLILAIVGQLLLYIVVGREFYRLIKKRLKQ